MRNNEELVRLYQGGDKHAMDELLENNSGIIGMLVKKYLFINRKFEFDDLFNSGVIGFIKAAQMYDFNNDKKAKFSTFAIFLVDKEIFTSINGRSSKDIENNRIYDSAISLNMPLGETEDSEELLHVVGDKDYGFENVEYQLYLKRLRSELEQVMNECLTLNQREVLKLRYGWNTAPMTLQEIGDILGMSRERVRQVEAKTLRTIRNSKWTRTTGREFAKELMGVVSTSYRSVENRIDFMDRYFKNVI
ncbi:MAG: sigma-70 family RNA polymerase sigma factor [Clostridium sp.]|nr:sigma-70 family RNA polymerase sigma factor [Clostridium sp.]